MESFDHDWLRKKILNKEKVTLYKCFSYNQNSLGPLIRGGLYFNKADNFNDPFDCKAKLILSKCPGRVPEAEQESRLKAAYEYASKLGIVCFNPEWDKTLMWAHYGDSFKGFCLGYEFEFPFVFGKEFATLDGEKYFESQYRLHQIRYSSTDEFPAWDDEIPFGDDVQLIEEFVVANKAGDWQYEHECRLTFFGGRNDDGSVKDGFGLRPVPGKLVEVFFGLKMQDDQKRVIYDILSKQNPKFYNTEESSSRFRINKKEYIPV